MRNVEKASKTVIGYCFESSCSSSYIEALGQIPISAFYPSHKAIVDAIRDFAPFDGGFSDLNAISAKISSMGQKVHVDILSDCACEVVTEKSALQCIEILIEIYHQTNVSKSFKSLSDECIQIESSVELKKWAGTAQKTTIDELSVFAQANFSDMPDLLSDAITGLQNPDLSMVRTGFRGIDKICGGLPRGGLILLGARPAMGKSSWAVCQAMRSAYLGYTGLFFSLEMTKRQLGQKMLSIAAQQSIQSLSRYMDIAVEAARKSDHIDIQISDESDLSVEDICGIVRQKKAVDFIIVDYLQLIRSTAGFQSREREVSHISRTLKILAKSTDSCVIALCQLNRNLESRPDRRPVIPDLRESGSLEQDADMVLFAYRDHVYNPEADPCQAEMIIAKNRMGPIGVARLRWDAGCTRFSDV